MVRLIRTELLKARTTRMVWGLLAGALLFVVLQVVVTISPAGNTQAGAAEAPGTAEGIKNVYSSAGNGGVLALVLGILGLAGEYRHRTITSAFLATPMRSRVVLAKAPAAYGLVGLLYGVVAALVTTALAWPWLSTKTGVEESPLANDVPLVLGAAVLVTGLYAVVGVGLGALIRNQAFAAVIVALAWTFVIEGLLISFPQTDDIGRWLPGNADTALLQTSFGDFGLLPPAVGGLVFLGYGLLFAALGTLFTIRRDVT